MVCVLSGSVRRVYVCELSVCARLDLREGEGGSTNGTQTFM